MCRPRTARSPRPGGGLRQHITIRRVREVAMRFEVWIAIIGSAGTLLLVLVGLLNFSIFSKQLTVAREQIGTAVRQLDLAQKVPDLHLIQRAIAETSDHVRLL